MPEEPVLELDSNLIIGGKSAPKMGGNGHDLSDFYYRCYMAFAYELTKFRIKPGQKITISDADDYEDDFVDDKAHAEFIMSAFVNNGYKTGKGNFNLSESPLLRQGHT